MIDKKRLVLTTSILLSAAMACATPYTMEIAKIIAEEASVVKVGTETDLVEAVSKNGSVELTQDIGLSSTLSIPNGVSVRLDLGGYKISTQNEQEEINAIDNRGTLDVKNGQIISNCTAVWTADAAVTNINNVDLDGYYHSVWNDGITNLTDCDTISHDEWETLHNEMGTMELRNVTANYCVWNDGSASDVVIYSGNYKKVENATLEGGTFDTNSVRGCILNGGEYPQANAMTGFSRVVVPEDSTLSFTFADGSIAGASLLGGTYDGTILASNGVSNSHCYSYGTTYGSGFKMTEGLAKSLESSWTFLSGNEIIQHVTGKKIQAIEGSSYYTVVDCATSTTKVALKNSIDSSKGNVSVFVGDRKIFMLVINSHTIIHSTSCAS